jgi:hypothetical protein
MLKLGNLIEEDIFLLDFDSLNDSHSWQENYKFHLINNEFKSFKIGIPFSNKNELVDLVNLFVESSEIKGSYFFYFDVTVDTKLLKLVESNTHEINDKKVFLLPHKNVNYSKFSSDFWEMNLLGYSIEILKCDSMKECQNNPKTINKYLLKGARIGITGSNKHSFGLLHKRRITQLFKEYLIDFWITETVNQQDNSYLQEIKLKTELLISVLKK